MAKLLILKRRLSICVFLLLNRVCQWLIEKDHVKFKYQTDCVHQEQIAERREFTRKKNEANRMKGEEAFHYYQVNKDRMKNLIEEGENKDIYDLLIKDRDSTLNLSDQDIQSMLEKKTFFEAKPKIILKPNSENPARKSKLSEEDVQELLTWMQNIQKEIVTGEDDANKT